MGDPSGNPIDAGGVHGLDDKEVEELKREFEKADTANAGAISQQQLRMIVFNRLYLERHPAILASLEASGYGSASILPAAPQSLGSARSSGELTSGAGASSLSESLPSGPLPQSQQPARDTLAQSQLGRARRKSLTLASSPSNNASPSASLASADDQARGSNWGKPEALTPTAYSWQAQFATNSNAGRKHSIMAKDSALGFLPKEYLADAETAKLVATRGLHDNHITTPHSAARPLDLCNPSPKPDPPRDEGCLALSRVREVGALVDAPQL